MSDDLTRLTNAEVVKRMVDWARSLRAYGSDIDIADAAFLDEAATRLSPPEGAGGDRVEAVARARVQDIVEREIAQAKNAERWLSPDIAALRKFGAEIASECLAALAVLPSEAEGAEMMRADAAACAGSWARVDENLLRLQMTANEMLVAKKVAAGIERAILALPLPTPPRTDR